METQLLDVEAILLDIEGTVCPISFVKDVLFPYALSALPPVLSAHWDSPEFTPYRDAFPAEHRTSPDALLSHVKSLMSENSKIAYLKSLQGYLWLRGYESGSLVCPLFPDVYPSLLSWHKAGISIVIYSSGSVAAQKLLFQYTNSKPEADLRGLIRGYFDTVNAGLKTEKKSYVTIWEKMNSGEEKGKWLFLSDMQGEVDAARGAGMVSLRVEREGEGQAPGNGKGKGEEGKEGKEVVITDFSQIKIKRVEEKE